MIWRWRAVRSARRVDAASLRTDNFAESQVCSKAGLSIFAGDVVAIAVGSALVCYRSGRLRIISWRRGRSADSPPSRIEARDSSPSANASKVLSARALLPIAPRRHSAASILSNSGEYILSTWPLPRPGRRLMNAPVYWCRFNRGICNFLDSWTACSAVNALAALEDGVADTCGDQALALRGVILAYPVPQVLSPNAFTNRRLLCLKHMAQSAAIGWFWRPCRRPTPICRHRGRRR
jgi:hypothetical protein